MPGTKGTCLPIISLKTCNCLDEYKVPTFKPYTCSTHKEEYVSMNMYVKIIAIYGMGILLRHIMSLDWIQCLRSKNFMPSFVIK